MSAKINNKFRGGGSYEVKGIPWITKTNIIINILIEIVKAHLKFIAPYFYYSVLIFRSSPMANDKYRY